MRAEIRVRVSKSGEAVMERYIHDENLRLFRKQLAEATHEKQRQLLRDLIAEKETKDPQWTAKPLPGSDIAAAHRNGHHRFRSPSRGFGVSLTAR
jgi:hypothetical protein